MTWISESSLVSAISNLGAFGCLAAGNLEPYLLEEEIDRTLELTDKSFAVNLITIAPNYKKHLHLVTEKNVPFIIFAGGIPESMRFNHGKLLTGIERIAPGELFAPLPNNESAAARC